MLIIIIGEFPWGFTIARARSIHVAMLMNSVSVFALYLLLLLMSALPPGTHEGKP